MMPQGIFYADRRLAKASIFEVAFSRSPGATLGKQSFIPPKEKGQTKRKPTWSRIDLA